MKIKVSLGISAEYTCLNLICGGAALEIQKTNASPCVSKEDLLRRETKRKTVKSLVLRCITYVNFSELTPQNLKEL